MTTPYGKAFQLANIEFKIAIKKIKATPDYYMAFEQIAFLKAMIAICKTQIKR
ncbi:hypothetical protein M0R72_12890 [Candidatus Pacearchaeota archaeon]|jgi:hypothetical protein|nr:hypothetical protein [Candidatus Pacearchaeota archaeon]